MRRFTLPVVLAIAGVVLAVSLDLWTAGRLESAPSSDDRMAFATRIRPYWLANSEASSTVDSVEVVFGRFSPDWPVVGELDWHGFHYAAHLHLNATGAPWVAVYRPDDPVDWPEVDFSTDGIAALTAFHRLHKGEPLSWMQDDPGELPSSAPAGSRLWTFRLFDPDAGQQHFTGGLVSLIQRRDGTFTLASDQ